MPWRFALKLPFALLALVARALFEDQGEATLNAYGIGGACLFVAAVLAITLIFDWARHDPKQPKPVVLADRTTWRRPEAVSTGAVLTQIGGVAFVLTCLVFAIYGPGVG